MHVRMMQKEAQADGSGCGVVNDEWADDITTQMDQGT